MAEFYFANLTTVNGSTEINFPTQEEHFVILLKVLVCISSTLSVIGSLMIILTYAFYKEMRTLARHTLVCLSIADLLVSLPSLLGIMTDLSPLDKANEHGGSMEELTSLGNWCKTQAAILVFGTESSILWTVGVAVYMFALVVIQPTMHDWGIKLVAVLHFICWGIPCVLTLWLLIDGFLWFDSVATPGFCAIVGVSTHHNISSIYEQSALYPIIVGYELWLYMAFIILPVLYITLSCHIRKKKDFVSSFKTTKQDVKLIFVPLIFMILRVWSIIVDIGVYYVPLAASVSFRQHYASAFVILEGVGDTAQGAVNGVLFCLFTKVVRFKICRTMAHFCHQKPRHTILSEESEEQNQTSIPIVSETRSNEQVRPLLVVSSNNYCTDYNSTAD